MNDDKEDVACAATRRMARMTGPQTIVTKIVCIDASHVRNRRVRRLNHRHAHADTHTQTQRLLGVDEDSSEGAFSATVGRWAGRLTSRMLSSS